jgi:hypothetical protein
LQSDDDARRRAQTLIRLIVAGMGLPMPGKHAELSEWSPEPHQDGLTLMRPLVVTRHTTPRRDILPRWRAGAAGMGRVRRRPCRMPGPRTRACPPVVGRDRPRAGDGPALGVALGDRARAGYPGWWAAGWGPVARPVGASAACGGGRRSWAQQSPRVGPGPRGVPSGSAPGLRRREGPLEPSGPPARSPGK